MTAFEILDAYIDRQIKSILKQCESYEREALIEFVRSCDLHTYFLYCFDSTQLGQELLRECSLIKMGLSPILKGFLPVLEKYEDGLPWYPSNKQNAAWADRTLMNLGTLVYLKRLAYSERFGLVDCDIKSNEHITIQVIGENSEELDLNDHAWLINQKIEKNKEFFELLNGEMLGWAREKIDKYVDVDGDWFIRYESDFDLLKLYEKSARLNFIKSPESESLPDEVFIGPRTFGEWKKLALIATARAKLHLSFATRLHSSKGSALDLRNLLTIYVRHEDLKAVWQEQTGLMQDADIDAITDVFMLTSERAEEYYRDHDNALPFHIRFGKYFALLPLYGALDNPCTFLVTELKRKYQKDWDRGVISRESKFRQDLYDLLPPPGYISGKENYVIKDEKGRPLTDIDAAIFDYESNTIYLFQLKWFDVFGLSLKQRKSKLNNLLHANKWVNDVWLWASKHDLKKVVRLLFQNSYEDIHPISFKLIVLNRYNTRFSGDDYYDKRASWLSWPAFVRTVSDAGESKQSLHGVLELLERDITDKDSCTPSVNEYLFPDLHVDVIL